MFTGTGDLGPGADDELRERIENLETQVSTLREELDSLSGDCTQLARWRDRWVARHNQNQEARFAWVATVMKHYRAAGRALVELPDMPDGPDGLGDVEDIDDD